MAFNYQSGIVLDNSTIYFDQPTSVVTYLLNAPNFVVSD